MMGRREDNQVQFLYAFDLDKVVPADHLVRQIDGVLDLSWVHKELAPSIRSQQPRCCVRSQENSSSKGCEKTYPRPRNNRLNDQ